jgi:NAD(P)-dependent dehydrogenase (short-subunit alcohol dehydrogenase family)
VVVGAARGIGQAIALAFAAEQAAVALLDRDALVEETARQVGGQSLGIVADVCDYPAMQQAARRIMAELGRIDHVVYAAGLGSGKFGFPFWNLTPADWPRVLEVNILGAVHTAHAFAPALIEARAGTLLFLSSVAGQIGSQTDPPYSAAKAALINFAQCAAKDLAPYQVRVNTLCPGMVKTTLNRAVWEAWNRQQPDDQKRSYEDWANDKVQKVVPLGRWQEPADIAAMAVFLASERGRNITGQTINVDGGFVMHW